MKNLIKIDIDGKPITKLLDVVSKGIGTMYKPRAIRKEADAEAYKIEAIAKAEAKKSLIESDTSNEVARRAKERLLHQEIQRQDNIENIVDKSIPHLEENVSEKEVESDWRTRFFQKAQDISNAEMQEVWARILATEVSKPGNIGFRTLEVVSNISKTEAEIFNKAAQLASNYDHIFKIDNSSADLKKYGLNYGELMILREAGLIHYSDTLNLSHPKLDLNSGPCYIVWLGKKQKIFVSKNSQNPSHITFDQIAFTKAGAEICKIIDAAPNELYFEDLVLELEKKYELLSLDDMLSNRNAE